MVRSGPNKPPQYSHYPESCAFGHLEVFKSFAGLNSFVVSTFKVFKPVDTSKDTNSMGIEIFLISRLLGITFED